MPMRRAAYPANWEEISHYIRFVRAGGKCEGSPAYPDCRAEHGQPHPVTGSKVCLTTAHYPDSEPGNVELSNLFAWCERCHNTMDAPMRLKNRRKKAEHNRQRAGQLTFSGVGEMVRG